MMLQFLVKVLGIILIKTLCLQKRFYDIRHKAIIIRTGLKNLK